MKALKMDTVFPDAVSRVSRVKKLIHDMKTMLTNHHVSCQAA
jgi:hypothetical protein